MWKEKNARSRKAFNAIDLEIIEAYDTILTPSEIKGFQSSLFYSPSGVESFFSANSYWKCDLHRPNN